MKKHNWSRKKVITTVSSLVFVLALGFTYFFTDLIKADTTVSPTEAQLFSANFDITEGFNAPAGFIASDINNMSIVATGYKWDSTHSNGQGKAVGAWVSVNDGKTWAESRPEGWAKTDQEKQVDAFHKLLNQGMYATNVTALTDAKKITLALTNFQNVNNFLQDDSKSGLITAKLDTIPAILANNKMTMQYADSIAQALYGSQVTIPTMTDDWLTTGFNQSLSQSLIADNSSINVNNVLKVVNGFTETERKALLTKSLADIQKACVAKDASLANVPAPLLSNLLVLNDSSQRQALALALTNAPSSGSDVTLSYEKLQSALEAMLAYYQKNPTALKLQSDTTVPAAGTVTTTPTIVSSASTLAQIQNSITEATKLRDSLKAQKTELQKKSQLTTEEKATLSGLDKKISDAEAQLNVYNKQKDVLTLTDQKANIKVGTDGKYTTADQKKIDDINKQITKANSDLMTLRAKAGTLLDASLMGNLVLHPEQQVYLYQHRDDIASSFENGVCGASCSYFIAATLKPGDVESQQILSKLIYEGKLIDKSLITKDGKVQPELIVKAVSDSYKKSDILQTSFRNSLSIDSISGHMQYVTTIRKKVDCVSVATSKAGDSCFESVGYATYDPFSQKFGAKLPLEFSGQNITFYQDPNSGYTYINLEKDLKVVTDKQGKPILDKNNKIQYIQAPYVQLGGGKNAFQLMSVKIANDGTAGGDFKAFGKAFTYNPNTKAVEIPLTLKNFMGTGQAFNATVDSRGVVTGSVTLASVQKVALNADGSPKLTEVKDKDGNLVKVADKQTVTNVSLGFDSRGNIYGNVTFNGQDGTALGGLSIGADGQIGGTLNVGQLVGINMFVGFDSNGISGVSLPVGSIGGSTIGFSVSNDGGLSIGFMVPGTPIPVSLGQTANGGFQLATIGIKWTLIGGDNRPMSPPKPKTISGTDNYDMSQVWYGHSLKKLFKTIRVYNGPVTLTSEQQKARSAAIFSTYQDTLGRNPSSSEFMNWYFWSGHQPLDADKIDIDGENQGDLLLTEMEKMMPEVIKGNWFNSVQKEYKFMDGKEYKCVQNTPYYKLASCPRPQGIMTADPFNSGAINNVQGAASGGVDQTSIQQFIAAVTASTATETTASSTSSISGTTSSTATTTTAN